MRILQINNYHYPRGGSETVYYNTGHLLESHGHEVFCFSSYSNSDEKYLYQTDRTKTCLVPRPDFKNSKGIISKLCNFKNFLSSCTNAKILEDFIKVNRPDVAHLHIFYGVLSNSILKVLKKYSIPTVMSVHEFHMLCPVYTCLDKKMSICEKCHGKNFYRCILKNCSTGGFLKSVTLASECYHRNMFINYLKYINHFIMVSNFIEKKHILFNQEFAKKSTVIHNFVDQQSQQPITKEKNIDFIYFGRLSAEKGLFTLLKAFEERPQYMLHIVGGGPIEASLKEYIATKKLTNVIMEGYRIGQDLISSIESSKCAIVPSEWYENNPLSVIEALGMGIPVIGSDIGGIPELIIDKKNGYICSPGDHTSIVSALDKLMGLTPESYQKMSVEATKFVQDNLSKQVHYTKLMKVYERAQANS